MRHPSTNGNAPGQPRRTRGAIRTHLGRKRIGPRARALRDTTLEGVRAVAEAERHRQEDLFDRMAQSVQEMLEEAGEYTLETLDRALDSTCATLVSAGEFTAESGERLRQFVRRDVLHRSNPELTFRTGDITTAGTLTCAGCGWRVRTTRTTVLPPCPQCSETAYHKGE